jgi:hypothetical protein
MEQNSIREEDRPKAVTPTEKSNANFDSRFGASSEAFDQSRSLLGGDAFNIANWPTSISKEHLQLAPRADLGKEFPNIQLTAENCGQESPKPKDYPQIKISDESRLPQVGMVIGGTALAMILTRNAHGAVMLFGTASGALVGGAVAYGYDRYLENKRGPVLTPTQADLQKKLLEKR